MPSPIKALIFDLDDTLFDCTGLLTDEARRRAARVLATPDHSEAGLFELQVELSDERGSTGALMEIGVRIEASRSAIDSAIAEYNRDEVESIQTFEDVPGTLTTLSNRGYALCLVTAGRPDRQRLKIQRLGLDSTFSDSLGNLWVYDGTNTKSVHLREAADRMGFDPPSVLSVGDKLDADIAVSNRLGMVTARLLHGRQKDRTPASSDETPDHTLHRIADLLGILT